MSMSYVNAKDILPNELLNEIRKYFNSGLIYIPLSENEYKQWGSNTETKDLLNKRNNEIKIKKLQGYSIQALAEEYHLSNETIKRILYRK